jgi:hypothetical protein
MGQEYRHFSLEEWCEIAQRRATGRAPLRAYFTIELPRREAVDVAVQKPGAAAAAS